MLRVFDESLINIIYSRRFIATPLAHQEKDECSCVCTDTTKQEINTNLCTKILEQLKIFEKNHQMDQLFLLLWLSSSKQRAIYQNTCAPEHQENEQALMRDNCEVIKPMLIATLDLYVHFNLQHHSLRQCYLLPLYPLTHKHLLLPSYVQKIQRRHHSLP